MNPLKKVLKVARTRPIHLWSIARMYFWFFAARLLWPVLGSKNVSLGKNVRLQRIASLLADEPDASIRIGDHSILYEEAFIGAYGDASVSVGDCSVLGPTRIYSRASVTIGKRFLSSWSVFIQDFDPHPTDPAERARQVEALVSGFRPKFDTPLSAPRYEGSFRSQPIVIGDDVWVGANVVIFKSARIGDGSIVAAGAVVLAGDYPPRSIIAGNPATVAGPHPCLVLPAIRREQQRTGTTTR